MKKTTLPILIFLLSLASNCAFSQDYAVLLASYNSKISLEDFKSLGKIEEFSEPPFYKYYLTGFSSEQDAQKAVPNAKAMGFAYARTENLSVIKRMKSGCCSNFEAVENDEISLKNIFFDFDKSNLTPMSVSTLNNAVRFLSQNKDCKIELFAHTDAKGTDQYNDALSERRKNSAKAFLVSKGISSSRISGTSLGEGRPVAKNDEGGQDLPDGRSLNRRVELVIYRNGVVVPIVETIEVPNGLK